MLAAMQIIAKGGKALYGAPLGILMLEAKFPAHPRGHGQRHHLAVPGALPRGARRDAGARGAERAPPACWTISWRPRPNWWRDGAEAITTNCGFLSLFQAELAAHVRVPVATSALIQVPWVQATLPPGQRVGIITVSAGSLTPRHLAAAGVPPDTPFVGTEDGREFFRVLIRGEKQDMDVALAAADILDAGRHAGRAPSRYRRDRAGVHQHAALRVRAARGAGPAGLRHLFADHLAACRAAATRVRAARRPLDLSRTGAPHAWL